jgi:hypothetical protein
LNLKRGNGRPAITEAGEKAGRKNWQKVTEKLPKSGGVNP